MDNWKMIRQQFGETLRRHRNILLVCAALATAIIGCLLLILLSPAQSETALAAESPDVLAGAGGTDDADAILMENLAKNEEMYQRMQEIYDYLVQLDSMVTDSQAALEEVRQQADAGIGEDEAMGEMQERLRSDVITLGDRLTNLHEVITSTRELLVKLQEETREGRTEGIETTMNSFSEVQNSITRIGSEFDDAIGDVESLIELLRSEELSGNEEMLGSLENMKNSMQQAQTQSFEELGRDISDMRESYMTALQELGQTMSGELAEMNADINDHVNNGLADVNDNMSSGLADVNQNMSSGLAGVNSNVETGFTHVNEQLGSLAENMQNGLDAQSAVLDEHLSSVENNTITGILNISNYLTRVLGADNDDGTTIIQLLSEYKNRVDESFTSVSNGKKLLANALLTKGSNVGGNIFSNEDIENKADSIPFLTYYEAILALEERYVVQSGTPASAVRITAHFHTAGSGASTVQFNSFEEYQAYLSSHSSYSSTSGSGGGCYSSPHMDYVYAGARKCGNWRPYDGGNPGTGGGYVHFRCDGCGEETTVWVYGDENGGGWGIGDHMIDEYSYVSAGYYDLSCRYQQGQILAIELIY